MGKPAARPDVSWHESPFVLGGFDHAWYLRDMRKLGATYRHGHNSRERGQTPTYQSWHCMKKRCFNPKHRHWASYGGRGITVCERWLDFANFLDDMGERPDGHTLDRIDVNGNYGPSNCRWLTHKEQMQNMRKTFLVEYEGLRMSLQQLSDKLGIDRYTLRRRILDMKWPVERWADKPLPRNNLQTKGRVLLASH